MNERKGNLFSCKKAEKEWLKENDLSVRDDDSFGRRKGKRFLLSNQWSFLKPSNEWMNEWMNEWLRWRERERGKDETFLRKQTEFEREFGCLFENPCEEARDFWYSQRKQSWEMMKRKSFVEDPTLVSTTQGRFYPNLHKVYELLFPFVVNSL